MDDIIQIWRFMFVNTWWFWVPIMSALILPFAMEGVAYQLLAKHGQATLRILLTLAAMLTSFLCLAVSLMYIYMQPAEFFTLENLTPTPPPPEPPDPDNPWRGLVFRGEPVWATALFFLMTLYFTVDKILIPLYALFVLFLLLRGTLDGLHDGGFMDTPLFEGGKHRKRKRRKRA